MLYKSLQKSTRFLLPSNAAKKKIIGTHSKLKAGQCHTGNEFFEQNLPVCLIMEFKYENYTERRKTSQKIGRS